MNADGRFLFEGLPPGTYSVKASVPAGLSQPIGYAAGFHSPVDALEVLAKGCAEVTFRTQPDGRIRGHILDQNGDPLLNAFISI